MAVYHATQRRAKFIDRTELFNATTSDLAFGLATIHDAIGPMTVMTYFYAIGAGEGTGAYMYAKTPSASAFGGRFLILDSGSPTLVFGATSTGTAGSPQRQGPAGGVPYNTWVVAAATWTGGLAGATINLYQGVAAVPITEVSSYSFTGDGTTTVGFGTGNNLHIGNREGTDRTFNGTIGWVARWLRILPLEEMRRVQQYGPLSSPRGLILCWLGGQDWSPTRLVPTTRTDVLFTGAAPMNNVLLDNGMDLYPFSHSLIVFDAASNSGYQAASSAYSWSHTCSGSERFLRIAISMLSVAGTSVSGITYNGVAMTLIGVQTSGTGVVRVEQWGLVAPATGSNTIAVTLSAATDSVGGADSFTTVHQTVPTEGFAGATAVNVGAADATVNVTTVADNDWVLDAVATDDGSISVGAGQTSRWNAAGALGSGAGSTEGLKTPAGSVTASWTGVAALATWSIAAFALRPISASGAAGRIVKLAGEGGGLAGPARGIAAAAVR